MAEWVRAAGNLEGIPSECGNLSVVASDPNRDLVVAGVALNGLFASTDGASTLQPLGTGPGSAVIADHGFSLRRYSCDPGDNPVDADALARLDIDLG